MSDETTPEHEPPLIDVSPALHMAGHEAELLGVENVEDTAPALTDDEDRGVDPVHHLGSDIATRGAGHAD
ncbi:MAG: hypothetical protein ACK4V6_13060 [Microthrixaceae bacterium]